MRVQIQTQIWTGLSHQVRRTVVCRLSQIASGKRQRSRRRPIMNECSSPSLPHPKIHRHHQERLAVVYVRQSTPQQMTRHPESTRLQYGLVDRALMLGWSRADAGHR
jgi:hypothetical protein